MERPCRYLNIQLQITNRIFLQRERRIIQERDFVANEKKMNAQQLSIILPGTRTCELYDFTFQNEKNQIMKSNVWLRFIWTDYQLQWDEADYGGIGVLRLPPDKVWKPDIVLFNKYVSAFNPRRVRARVSLSSLSLSSFRPNLSPTFQNFAAPTATTRYATRATFSSIRTATCCGYRQRFTRVPARST